MVQGPTGPCTCPGGSIHSRWARRPASGPYLSLEGRAFGRTLTRTLEYKSSRCWWDSRTRKASSSTRLRRGEDRPRDRGITAARGSLGRVGPTCDWEREPPARRGCRGRTIAARQARGKFHRGLGLDGPVTNADVSDDEARPGARRVRAVSRNGTPKEIGAAEIHPVAGAFESGAESRAWKGRRRTARGVGLPWHGGAGQKRPQLGHRHPRPRRARLAVDLAATADAHGEKRTVELRPKLKAPRRAAPGLLGGVGRRIRGLVRSAWSYLAGN